MMIEKRFVKALGQVVQGFKSEKIMQWLSGPINGLGDDDARDALYMLFWLADGMNKLGEQPLIKGGLWSENKDLIRGLWLRLSRHRGRRRPLARV
jgi:hypothetical protein